MVDIERPIDDSPYLVAELKAMIGMDLPGDANGEDGVNHNWS